MELVSESEHSTKELRASSYSELLNQQSPDLLISCFSLLISHILFVAQRRPARNSAAT
jgi:hypothetical protein